MNRTEICTVGGNRTLYFFLELDTLTIVLETILIIKVFRINQYLDTFK